jgi:peptidoglycan/xylan/chitin deacetylase (PgdA/CDA1 family)
MSADTSRRARAAGASGPVAVATAGKGPVGMVRRGWSIGARYGVSPERMRRRLDTFVDLLDGARGAATFPVTAAAVARNPEALRGYLDRGVEFAVHGLHHVDHVALPEEAQHQQAGHARRVLAENGLRPRGFRAPYLRTNAATVRALRALEYDYDASPAVALTLPGGMATDAYARALDFYGARAVDGPVLPWDDDGLLRIPYCLPDDESVVERLGLGPDGIRDLWVELFIAALARGDLFTVGVHPERIDVCAAGVRGVLAQARARDGDVWVARLHEIAAWWRRRATARIVVEEQGEGRHRVRVTGPSDLTVLARGIAVPGAQPWGDGWVRVTARDLEVPAGPAPTVDHSAVGTAAAAASGPALWVGRWPDGARAALAVTGDIDALTVADYALRLVGR